MPLVFDRFSSLRDGMNRNQAHRRPPAKIVEYVGWPGSATPSNITQHNTSIMHRVVVGSRTPHLFMGGSFLSRGTQYRNATGQGEDMGHFYSAGRDPIFYGHHANVDRIWSVWERLAGVNTNSRFQNREFSFFFDEMANLVSVGVRDCLTSSSRLNITYEPASKGDASRQNLGNSQDQKIESTKALKGPLSLIDTTSTLVSPPPIGEDRISSQQPVLVLENVRLFMSNPMSFAVFINYPDANSETGLDCAECVGLYTNLPHLDMDGMKDSSNILLKFPLGESLEILNLDVNSPLIVTVVTRSNIDPIKNPVTIGSFSIVYE